MLAAAFRLLDLGFFRVGGETYAEDNGTYGLATMRREHVTVTGDVVTFDYTAKSGKQRVQAVVDPSVAQGRHARCSTATAAARSCSPTRTANGWHDIGSADINAYLREVVGDDVSAKDFRTWHATVLMAVGLAVSTGAPTSPTRPQARRQPSRHRGGRLPRQHPGRVPHAPTSTRASSTCTTTGSPSRDRWSGSATRPTFGQPATHGAVEAAVLRLLSSPRRRASKSKVAATAA